MSFGLWLIWFAVRIKELFTLLRVSGNATVAVTYPAGLFTEAPFVTVTVSHVRVNAAIINNTATGCTVNLSNWTTAAANGVTVEWRAEER